MRDTLVVIDGHSLMYRAFYALPLLTNEKGLYTNAVYGFMNMMLRAIQDIKPTHLAVAFDLHGPTFRHEKYSDYKAGRKPQPEELRPQFETLKQVLHAMDIPVLEKEGYEADDILGTLSKWAETEGMRVRLITGDKDTLQLISELTHVVLTKRGISDHEEYDVAKLYERYELAPAQIPDLKGLMGDSSDNIPGIPGVGEKTALKLLKAHQTVEGLLANTDTLKGKLKEKVENNREMAEFSKVLATIDCDVPLDVTLEGCRITPLEETEVLNTLEELSFKSLLRRIREMVGESTPNKLPEIEVIEIGSLDEVKKFAEELKGDKPIALALEENFHLCDGDKEYKIPIMKDLLNGGFDLNDVIPALQGFLESETPKVVYDAKAWMTLCHEVQVDIHNITFDIRIAAYLLNKDIRRGFTDLLLKVMDCTPGDAPASAMLHLQAILDKQMVDRGKKALFEDLEMPLVAVIYRMEQTGFMVDVEVLKEIGATLSDEIKKLTDEIYHHAGCEFNINSTKQLGEILFEVLELTPIKKKKTGWSTDAEVLDALRDDHAIIPCLLRYRQLSKLMGTYIDGMIPLIKRTGRIHTKLHQLGASTGRLSSSDPNLQNIPVRTVEGRMIRKAFVASDDDHILVDADYSQIELRVLAHIAKDENMIMAFNSGADIHRQTASQVFDVPFEEVTAEQRSSAKAVNFGIVYGISDYGLSRQLGISRKEARSFIDKYLETFPGVHAFMQQTVENGREKGFVETMFRRRIYLPQIKSSNYNRRSAAERLAMNAPIQGSAADIIKMAMTAVDRRLMEEELESKLILQVHDELIIDAKKSELEQVKKVLKEEMQNVVNLSCPLVVDVATGRSWYEAK